MSDKLLDIYLSDHFAGSTGGFELARRIAESPSGNEELHRIAAEIDEDREVLRGLMAALGVEVPALKSAMAWVGEKAGRLKLNDRIFGRSPLSGVIELEGLIIGVSGKLELWRSMEAIAPSDARLTDFDFRGLAERAESQRSRLEREHRRAVEQALG